MRKRQAPIVDRRYITWHRTAIRAALLTANWRLDDALANVTPDVAESIREEQALMERMYEMIKDD